MRGDIAVVDPRVGALPEDRGQVGRSIVKGAQLIEARWQQHEDAATPRQRLRNRMGEPEMLGAGQDEPARIGASIDLFLQIRQQLRDVLNLVEDRAVGVLGEKSARIVTREIARIQCLQRHIGPIREGCTTQRRLTGLARAGNDNNRVVARQPDELRSKCAGNHRLHLCVECMDCKSN